MRLPAWLARTTPWPVPVRVSVLPETVAGPLTTVKLTVRLGSAASVVAASATVRAGAKV